jgi:hypothetical protein
MAVVVVVVVVKSSKWSIEMSLFTDQSPMVTAMSHYVASMNMRFYIK